MLQSHWTYNGKQLNDLPEEVFGFVYKITNLENNKFYIGKKQGIQTRKKTVKLKSGKKTKRRVTSDSNWREYTGSSESLNKDIEQLGKDKFKFEILTFAYSKGQLSYLEENAQMKWDTLTEELCYNDSVGNSHFRNIRKDEKLIQSLLELKFKHKNG